MHDVCRRSVANQFDNSFNMAGLREHIKGLDALKVIAAVTQQAQIPGKGGRIAGYIHNVCRV